MVYQSDNENIYQNFSLFTPRLNSLNENLIAIQPKLLWENSSPTSNFSAQSVSLDANVDYLMYLTVFATNTNGDSSEKFSEIAQQGLFYARSLIDVGAPVTFRQYTVSRTSISFEDAYRTSTARNDLVIPLRVYGLFPIM